MGANRRERGPGHGTRGFTLVELLLLLVLLSILAALARPMLHRARVRARATHVVEALHTVKAAVFDYRADRQEWPADVTGGTLPPGLGEYLPEGFSFRHPGYVLDYEDWSRLEGSPFQIGLSFVSSDRELAYAVMDLLGSDVWSDGGSRYTWVMEGSR